MIIIEYLYLTSILISELMQMKRGPQDVPRSPYLPGVLVGLFFLLEFISAQVTGAPNLGLALSLSLVDIIFMVAFIKLILLVFGMIERFKQTFSAIVATHIGFLCLFLPLQYMLFPYVGPQDANVDQTAFSGVVVVATLVYFAAFMWFIRVQAYIYANTLEVRTVFAVGVVILQLVSNLIVSALLVKLTTFS